MRSNENSVQHDAEYVSVLRSDLQYLLDVFIESGWAEDEDLPIIDRIHAVLLNDGENLPPPQRCYVHTFVTIDKCGCPPDPTQHNGGENAIERN